MKNFRARRIHSTDEFGDTGNDTSCEKEFKLSHRRGRIIGAHVSTNKTVLS